MNNGKKLLKNLTAKLASTMINHDAMEWPPVCSILAYQPVHPSVLMQDNTDDKSVVHDHN